MDYSSEARIKMMERQAAASKPAVSAYVQQRMAYQQTPPENRRPGVAQLRQYIATPEAEKDFYKWVRSSYGFATSQRDLDNGYLDPTPEMVEKALSQYAYNRTRVSKHGKNELKYGTLDYDPWDKDEADNEDWGAFYRDYERTPSDAEMTALRNQRAAKLQGVDSMTPSAAAWDWKSQYTYDQNDANDRARQKLAKAGYNVMPKALLAEYTNDTEDQRRLKAGLPPLRIERTQQLIYEMGQYKAEIDQLLASGRYNKLSAEEVRTKYPMLDTAQGAIDYRLSKPESADPLSRINEDIDPLSKYFKVDVLKQNGYDPTTGFDFFANMPTQADMVAAMRSAAQSAMAQPQPTQATQQMPQPVVQPPQQSAVNPLTIPGGMSQLRGNEREGMGNAYQQANPQPVQQPSTLDNVLTGVSRVLNAPQALYLNAWNAAANAVQGRPVQYNPEITGAQYAAERAEAAGAPNANIPAAMASIYTNDQTKAATAKALGLPEDSAATEAVTNIQSAGAQLPYEAATDPSTVLGAGELAYLARGGKPLQMGTTAYETALRSGKLTPETTDAARAALNTIGADQAASVVQREATEAAANRAAADAATGPAVTVQRGLPEPVVKPPDFTVTPEGQALRPGQKAPLALPEPFKPFEPQKLDATTARPKMFGDSDPWIANSRENGKYAMTRKGNTHIVVEGPTGVFNVVKDPLSSSRKNIGKFDNPFDALDLADTDALDARPLTSEPAPKLQNTPNGANPKYKVEAPAQILPREMRNLKKQGIVPQTTKLSDVNAAAAEAQRAAGRVANDATANTLRNPILPKALRETAYPNAGNAWGNMPVPRALRDATAGPTMPKSLAIGNTARPAARAVDAPQTATPRNMAQAADDVVDELIVDPKVEARAAKAKAFAEQPGGNLESAAQKISYDVKKPRPKLLSMFDNLRSQVVDKYANIERAEKTILGKVQEANASAYKQARLYAGVPERANLAIQKELTPVIKSVEKAGKTHKDLSLYALAVHAKDVNARGMVSGFTNAEIDDVIRQLGTPEMETARKALVDYSNRRLDTLVESGRISAEDVAKMRERWKNYIPLSRVMDETEAGFIKGVSDSFASVAQPIKSLQGSERKVIDPIESLMRNTYLIENAAGRAEVGKRLGMLADADGEQRFFRKLTDTEAEGKAYVIKAYQNGKEVKYETTKEIFNEVAGMNKEQSATVIKILSAPASVLRAGATLTTEFSIRNPIRDIISAWNVSDVGFNPITDFPRGLASAIKKDGLYQEFINSKGGFGNIVSMDRAQYRAAIEGAINQPVTKRFVTVLNPKTWLEGLRTISDTTETATKVGVFNAAKRKGLSAAEAAYQARDTMDFARAGSAVQPANRIIAFLNANIQGKSKLIRAIQEKPVKTMAKIATSIMLPSVGAFFWNDMVANDEQKRTIDDAPTWLRDTFWLMAIPGTNQVARIPKPFDLAVFANTTERFMDYAVKKDPKAFDGFRGDILKQQALPVMPTGLLPLFEGLANYSVFRQGPIVPQREEGIPTAEQYDSGTSETAKGVAAAVRAVTGGERSTSRFGSPRVMDYAIRSSTGGLGGYALDAIDVLLESVGLVPNKNRTAKNTSELPLARAFLVKEGSAGQSMDFVYTERDAMTRERNSFRKQNPEAQYPNEAKHRYISAAADAVGELSAQVRDIENSPTMDPKVKRDEINNLNGQRNAITQAAKEQFESAADMAVEGMPVVLPFVLTGSNPNTNVEKTIVLTPEQQRRYQQELQQRVSVELERLRSAIALKPAAIRQKTIGDTIEKIRTAMKNEILWGR